MTTTVLFAASPKSPESLGGLSLPERQPQHEQFSMLINDRKVMQAPYN